MNYFLLKFLILIVIITLMWPLCALCPRFRLRLTSDCLLVSDWAG